MSDPGIFTWWWERVTVNCMLTCWGDAWAAVTHLLRGSKDDVLCDWARRGSQCGVSCVRGPGHTVTPYHIPHNALRWCSVLHSAVCAHVNKVMSRRLNPYQTQRCPRWCKPLFSGSACLYIPDKIQSRKRNVIICWFSQMMFASHSDELRLVGYTVYPSLFCEKNCLRTFGDLITFWVC